MAQFGVMNDAVKLLAASAEQAALAAALSPALLHRFDVPGPRYTSYPTADRFVEAFGPADYRLALAHRAGAGAGGGAAAAPLSIYVHVPFCESVCYYCACNKVITRHHQRSAEYLGALQREIDLHVAVLGRGAAVSQLHLGGGTPTFMSDAELNALLAMLRSAWRLVPGGEYSIEVDPRTVTLHRLKHLRALGFNRLSFGVQDLDPLVQQAVHRVQSEAEIEALVHAARTIGFESINLDLIYGLPRQTPDSFARTLARVAAWRPDRIALYAYAHLPQRFKPQRRIDAATLPQAAAKIGMLSQAIARFLGSGYTYIGMDHFALADDSLAVAKRQGRLHRNFQGYSTQPDCDLIGLGCSAIGRIGATYSQNAKTLDEYYDALKRGSFPIVRGLALTRDDLVRRSAIMALMCQGRLDFEALESAYLIKAKAYFANELAALSPLAEMELLRLDDEALEVTATGWFYVRAIAMHFDRHLQADHARERFSRVI